MKKHLMLVKLSAAEQFKKIYAAVQSGRIFLQVPDPMPDGESIVLKLLVSPIEQSFLINGMVLPNPKEKGRKTGMMVDISENVAPILEKLEEVSTSGSQVKTIERRKKIQPSEQIHAPEKKQKRESEDQTNKKIDRPQKIEQPKKDFQKESVETNETVGRRLTFNEVKTIVSSEEIEIDLEKEKEVPDKVIAEKKELTLEERKMAEPVAKFIMNLTKAMSRSGYYDPNHPSSKIAKKGLYEEFIKIIGNFNEISFTNQTTRDSADIFITGILDNQVNVRSLVGAGAAELFVPKLTEYCERKQLLSFAIKKEITSEHFDKFIDIMSDPMVDHHNTQNTGAFLTNTLIENDITEISTVFFNDMVDFEKDLPWRVQMAIHRLSKDFKVIPMFKGVATDAIRKIKLQTVQDIIRPLNHPKYFNDFLVNCYIISKHITDMPPEEIEKIVVDAFPLHLLFQISQYTFKELEYIQELKKEQPDNPTISGRFAGIRRILKMIASRIVIEKASGAVNFLEQLFRNNILTFKELPAEAQYLINTRNIADDIQQNIKQYRANLLNAASADEALVYLKCFRRTVPIFVQEGQWSTLLEIASLINQASAGGVMVSDEVIQELKNEKNPSEIGIVKSDHSVSLSQNVSDNLLAYVFNNAFDKLALLYQQIDNENHPLITETIDNLGSLSVGIYTRVIAESTDKDIRKLAMESLIKQGPISQTWAKSILEDSKKSWFLHRNAMIVLRNISRDEKDFECIRKFAGHSNSRIREEVINLVAVLKPFDAESLIIDFLDDPDVKVRWRATRALNDISPISDSSIDDILKMITSPIPEDKEKASEQVKKIINLISAVNGLQEIPNSIKVESSVISILKNMAGQDKGFLKFIKKVAGSEEEISVLKAAIPLLGRVGGPASEGFLKKIGKSHSQLSDIIQKALEKIHEQAK